MVEANGPGGGSEIRNFGDEPPEYEMEEDDGPVDWQVPQN